MFPVDSVCLPRTSRSSVTTAYQFVTSVPVRALSCPSVRCRALPQGRLRPSRAGKSLRPRLRPKPAVPTVEERCSSVDLFEYQAKQLFSAHGVPVSLGDVADTPSEAESIAA